MNMNIIKMPRRLSVSSWSLHRALGAPEFYGVGQAILRASHDRGALRVLDLPQQLAEFGISTTELCHFHLPSVEADYLRQMREALEKFDVELWALLVDEATLQTLKMANVTRPELKAGLRSRKVWAPNACASSREKARRQMKI